MIELYTIQLSNINLITQDNVRLIDTTVKSGYKILAPTWDMVMDFKSGKLSWDEYTKIYNNLMVESLDNYPEMWKSLFHDNTTLALGCYCRPGRSCHRHLLKDIIVDWKGSQGVEVVDMGEIT